MKVLLRHRYEFLSEMASSSEERYSMKMLEGDRNWRTWKIQMKALVMEKKLLGYVDESAKLKDDPSEKILVQ